MYGRVLTLAAFLVATATGVAGAADVATKAKAAPISPPPFFFVNENSIGYHYEFTATNPGAGQTPKNVLTFSHFDVWQYGTNFINIDWLKATDGKATPTATGSEGYTEIYGFFRSTFGFNEIFNTKAFSAGPLTDVSLMVGADLNTDNTGLGSAKRSIESGIQFSFMAPYKGFINLTPTIYKEWQHDGYAPPVTNGAVDFNATWGFEWLYVQPLGFVPSVPLTFKAFGTIHGPKGMGEPASVGLKRTTEYYTQENLELDLGQMLGGKPGMFSVWTGFRYWVNKFGIDPTQPFGNFGFTKESTWLVGSTLAF